MRGFVGAIQMGGLWPTGPLPKDIGGRVCRKPFRIMLRSVINVRDMPQLFINQGGGFMNPFPVLGLSLSGVWTYWGHFLEPQEAEVVLVGIGYFTKWVEFEPLYNIRDVDAKRFIWRNVITKFGVPQMLISDNVLQFDSKAFRRYCGELGIRNRYSTPTMGRMRLIIRL